MRGRKPKPSALKNARTSHRHPHANEPQPRPGAPDPPAWLSPAARQEWDRVAPELARMGLLTRVDMAALAAYAQCYAHYVEAETFIQQHGLTLAIRDDKGVLKAVQAVPEVQISLKMLDKIRAFAGEFGLSPSSRGRIDPLEDLTPDEKETYREEIEKQIRELEAGGVEEDARAAVQ